MCYLLSYNMTWQYNMTALIYVTNQNYMYITYDDMSSICVLCMCVIIRNSELSPWPLVFISTFVYWLFLSVLDVVSRRWWTWWRPPIRQWQLKTSSTPESRDFWRWSLYSLTSSPTASTSASRRETTPVSASILILRVYIHVLYIRMHTDILQSLLLFYSCYS